MKEFKRTSAEYRDYISGVIDEYNRNGKKTVLLTCDSAYPVVDGVWRVMENCAKIIQKDYPDYNVLILAPEYRGIVYIDEIPILSVHSGWLKGMRYQLSMPMFDNWMKKQLRRLKIDIIHCHSPFLIGLYVLKVHRRRKIPMVATFHSQFKQDMLKVTHSKMLTRIGLNIIMRVFNGSDEVWTMHTASRDTLYSYGYKGQCRLMPNATPLKPLQNYDEVREKFRAERNLQNKTMFIFVGRMVTQKGILFVADVLARLRELGIDYMMYFIGDGPDLQKLKDKVNTLKLNDCVEFTGEIMGSETMAPYYAAADLFLFPSLYDVSSIVQIEAATYKTPTVFAEGSVTGCTATNGVNGFAFPFDVEKYSQGVAAAIRSGKLSEIGENALRDIHIEWKDVVAKNIDAYETILNNKK